jgi:hypothetical protein
MATLRPDDTDDSNPNPNRARSSTPRKRHQQRRPSSFGGAAPPAAAAAAVIEDAPSVEDQLNESKKRLRMQQQEIRDVMDRRKPVRTLLDFMRVTED